MTKLYFVFGWKFFLRMLLTTSYTNTVWIASLTNVITFLHNFEYVLKLLRQITVWDSLLLHMKPLVRKRSKIWARISNWWRRTWNEMVVWIAMQRPISMQRSIPNCTVRSSPNKRNIVIKGNAPWMSKLLQNKQWKKENIYQLRQSKFDHKFKNPKISGNFSLVTSMYIIQMLFWYHQRIVWSKKLCSQKCLVSCFFKIVFPNFLLEIPT